MKSAGGRRTSMRMVRVGAMESRPARPAADRAGSATAAIGDPSRLTLECAEYGFGSDLEGGVWRGSRRTSVPGQAVHSCEGRQEADCPPAGHQAHLTYLRLSPESIRKCAKSRSRDCTVGASVQSCKEREKTEPGRYFFGGLSLGSPFERNITATVWLAL